VGRSARAHRSCYAATALRRYRTFINYNIYWPTRELPDSAEPVGALHHEGKKEGREVPIESIATPTEASRHAPSLGASVHSFEMRTMLYEPRSREIFEKCATFCRDVIAAHIAQLSEKA
jgi:hypothetical protein